MKFAVLSLPLFLTISFILFLGFHLTSRGIRVLSWEFLTQPPREGMKEGGFFPCFVGTLYLSLVSFLFSVPVGVGAGAAVTEGGICGESGGASIGFNLGAGFGD